MNSLKERFDDDGNKIVEIYAGDLAKLQHDNQRDKLQLEWLWANCKIVYFPAHPEYPFEHTLAAGKDMRELIEKAMKLPK